MIKGLLIAVLFAVLGWYGRGWYEQGFRANVTVQVTAPSSASVAPAKVSPARQVQKPTTKVERAPTFDDGIDYNRTHPAYTTPGIGYYPPPTI